MEKELKRELSRLRELESRTERALIGAPEGKLRCAVNKGSYQYYIGKQYQNKKKRKLVQRIAQKEYFEELLIRIRKRRIAMEKFIHTMEIYRLDSVYDKLHPARKQLVEPFVKPVPEIVKEFEDEKYEGKKFSEDDGTAYYTVKGERVRSKSEKIIADTLSKKEIPYHYEFPTELKYKNRTILIYPDFTILNRRTGKKYILEHLGMMDKTIYFENTLRKLDVYQKNGILLGEGLILTYETSESPLDTSVLKKYVERFLE